MTEDVLNEDAKSPVTAGNARIDTREDADQYEMSESLELNYE